MKIITIALIMSIVGWLGFLLTRSPTVMGFAMGCNLFYIIAWFMNCCESNREKA